MEKSTQATKQVARDTNFVVIEELFVFVSN